MFKKFVFVIILSLGFLATPVVAQADPSPEQPANIKMKQSHAREYARYVVWSNLVSALPAPKRIHKTQKCRGGPWVWRCPSTFSNTETRCSVVTWIWAPNHNGVYYEFHKLSCKSK